MQEYITFMNRKDAKNILRLLLFCALCVAVFGTVAYLNTRFNGFADVHPAAHYFEKIQDAWQKICDTLFLYPARFINFFRLFS